MQGRRKRGCKGPLSQILPEEEARPVPLKNTDRNLVDNFLQVEIYLALVANI